MKKGWKIASIFLSMLMFAAGGVTYAYLTDQDQADNYVSCSQVTTQIVEEFEPPGDPHPGTIIKKAPRVVSESDVNCYVRVRVVFTNDGDRICEPLSVNSGWEQKEDGFYYWHEPLVPGGGTKAVFEQVRIREDLREEELVPFDILVYSESVQSGDLSPEEAWNEMDYE